MSLLIGESSLFLQVFVVFEPFFIFGTEEGLQKLYILSQISYCEDDSPHPKNLMCYFAIIGTGGGFLLYIRLCLREDGAPR